jgi:histidyl-tRNA synthetase
MRDFTPAAKAKRERVLQVIRDVYRGFGYAEIETPALEDLAVLTSGQGGDNEKMLYRVLRRGLDESAPIAPADAADLGLRFDLTLPLARFYATNRTSLPSPFRAVQIAPVWRAERPQKGRYRQFTQCDIDIVGESGTLAEVELIVATLTALQRLGIEGSRLRLNDRRLLLAVLDHAGFDPDDHPSVLITVDKLDKIGVEGVRAELLDRGLGSPAATAALVELLTKFESLGPAATFDEVASLLPAELAPEVVAGLRQIDADVRRAVPEATTLLDLSLVRGMGYYTGPIFELAHPSSAGSVAGGGRYDGMIGRFLKTDVPACGFSIGFERIVDLVPDRPETGVRRVALVYGPDVPAGELVHHQSTLVREGAQTRLVPRTKRLGATLSALREEGFTERQDVGYSGGEVQIAPPQPIT